MVDASEEEVVPEEEVESSPAALKAAREKLKKAVEEKQEYMERWQRERADFVNYKREEAALLEEKESRIKSDLLESILPALDTFELALLHGPNEDLSRIHKQLLQGLERIGIVRYGAPGEQFDPRMYEALSQKETEDATQDYTVESVQRPGFKAGDIIIRPAQVSIFIHQKQA